MQNKAIGIIGALLAAIVCCGCSSGKTASVALQLPPDSLLRDGDLVFRLGVGVNSRIVLAADGEGVYSHTGVLKQERGTWYVIHAVPDEPEFAGDEDRVKQEPLARFFAADRAAKGVVMRTDASDSLAARAAHIAWEVCQRGILFDHRYDLTDTTEMYCTELIQYAYLKQGIDLAEGNISPFPFLGRKCILPGDLIRGNHLSVVCTLEEHTSDKRDGREDK